jgi:hypothetical protein
MKQIIATCLILATTLVAFAQPERDKGLSLHMLPDRVAKISNQTGGFTVSTTAPKREIPAMDANKTLEYFLGLPDAVQKNGIWIVYSHPSSYSEKEKTELKNLINECKKKSIPIFTCRAAELDKKNWKAGGLIE